MQEEINQYHGLAKDAGNRLRAYILSVSSGATGVFFLALSKDSQTYSGPEKILLSVALIGFVITAVLCLYELRVDAKRFFALTQELKKPLDKQCWEANEKYKKKRYWLIHSSYVTLGIAMTTTSAFLVLRILCT
ncbi:hypothetical protein [Vibrio cholerae]|uniref:hypothetical protein n=1 Tax=Vibrio cholerae TaxID=666 RepID=UPI00115912C2|nr:hypothetical protein [Vibrio cholerae]TQP21730.1 hypothetical protein FLM04_11110 [Vibrio cholerae]TQP69724.1 hypothetical protein FLL75_18625 [Vibrio cholerae]TQQ46412.1 hypothetical protein FLL62_18660 [Vibrio cholerae]GIA35523.1 hypothetical protein VCSRO85_3397 [Vibrio cholerae]